MTKLQINLTDEAYERIVQASREQGISVEELLRRALNLEEAVRTSGEKVYVGNVDDGEIRELQVA